MKKSKSKLGLVFKILLILILLFFAAAFGANFAYNKLFGTNISIGSLRGPDLSLIESLFGKDINVNVAVFGMDEGETRTDVIFIVNYDSKSEKVSVVSLPRDTRVEICDEAKEIIDAEGRWYPKYCKLNEVHAYAGKEKGVECALLQIEDILGIEINHYVKFNIEGFKKTVDAIGGVEVDVPQDMYYKDPEQGLYINLKAGLQVLDGEKAEQLVRFRQYPMGDLARIETQQLFLKAFAEKIMDLKTITSNFTSLVNTVYNYVETDVKLSDAIKYITYLDDVDMDKLSMQTLPGGARYIDNISYFIADEAETAKLVQDVFFPEEELVSLGKAIEVSNGGDVSGLAGKTGDKLKSARYNVVEISNFYGEKTDYTRIIVKEDGLGSDLTKYFKDARIAVSPETLDDKTDILIILGTGEK